MATVLLAALDRFLEAVSADVAKTRALGPIERRLEVAIRRAFILQERDFLRRFAKLRPLFVESLREALADTDWGPGFDDAARATASDFINPIEAAVAEALAAGGEATLADLMVGGSFDLANPRAVSYLRDYGAKLVAGIDDTTRAYIRTIITEGVDKGWSYNQMAKAISDRYAEFRVGRPQAHIASRAHMIAVTESGSAYARGNAIVAENLAAAGLEMEKHWIVTGGEICAICLGNEAEGWIPVAQAWSGGVMQPLQHPACRCAAGYRRKGAEELDFTSSHVRDATARQMMESYTQFEEEFGFGPCGNMSALLREMNVGEVESCLFVPTGSDPIAGGFGHYYVRTLGGIRVDITNPFLAEGVGGRYMEVEILGHDEMPELVDRDTMDWLRRNVIEKVLRKL